MDIGRIGHSGRLPGDTGEFKRPRTTRKAPNGEKVAISEAAKKAEEVAAFVKILRGMPDIRKDIIEEVRGKISSGKYPDARVIQETADKILSG